MEYGIKICLEIYYKKKKIVWKSKQTLAITAASAAAGRKQL
jgi:hypothetical protein